MTLGNYKRGRILLFLAGFLGASGCGSSSAPPISLPAPVTGRMTITSPDEEGMALVAGDENAVPADAVVHVVNESQASSVAWRLSSLVRSADAQSTFPSKCSQAFHACGRAETDGSFQIEVAASEDDQIGVEVIDETSGRARSERIRRSVPDNFRRFFRAIRDVGIDSSRLYALLAGSADPPANGFIVILDTTTELRTRIPFVTDNPIRLVLHPDSSLAAVADSSNDLVALVDLNQNNFDDPVRISLSAPTDVAFDTSGATLFVGSRSPLNVLSKIDIASSEVVATIRASEIIPNVTAGRITAIELKTFTLPDDPSQEFSLLAFVGLYTVNQENRPVIGLVNADTFELVFGPTTLPDGATPTDVACFQTPESTGCLVTDSGNDQVHVYQMAVVSASEASLTRTQSLTDPTGTLVDPQNLLVDTDSSVAFITARNHNDERPDSLLTLSLNDLSLLSTLPVGHLPSGIATDGETVYVSSMRSHSVTSYSLEELIP